MAYNIEEELELKLLDGTKLKEVNDFKYLGSWVDSTEEDIRIRKGLVWAAANKMKKKWKSNILMNLKECLFVATVESVLLYGSEAWTLTKSLEKQLNGYYTRLL